MDMASAPQPWLDPRIEIAASSIEGRGLFAREPIAAGEVVNCLCGEVPGQLIASLHAATIPVTTSLVVSDVITLERLDTLVA
jgi:hypothetical protein